MTGLSIRQSQTETTWEKGKDNLTPDCTPHGVELDPVSNVALLGCNPGGQVMLDLNKGGAVIKTFTNVTGSDLTAFNPNTRNFYTGSGSNNIASTGCPIDSSKNNPLIGIFNAPAAGQANLVGVQCSGRTAKGQRRSVFAFMAHSSRIHPNVSATSRMISLRACLCRAVSF